VKPTQSITQGPQTQGRRERDSRGWLHTCSGVQNRQKAHGRGPPAYANPRYSIPHTQCMHNTQHTHSTYKAYTPHICTHSTAQAHTPIPHKYHTTHHAHNVHTTHTEIMHTHTHTTHSHTQHTHHSHTHYNIHEHSAKARTTDILWPSKSSKCGRVVVDRGTIRLGVPAGGW
jgi:hypothetical protein